MSPLDAEHPVLPSPASRKNAPISLTSGHIQDALVRSNDGGATLVFMKKNLTDIGSDAAEELVAIGRDSSEDEGRLQRHVSLHKGSLCNLAHSTQDIARAQSAGDTTNGIRASFASKILEFEKQFLLWLSRRGMLPLLSKNLITDPL
jgi:hypothetical protein